MGATAILFRQHKVQPRRDKLESEGQAMRRLEQMIEDSSVAITLQMNHPQQVALV